MGKKLEVVQKVFKGGKKAIGSINKALQSDTARNMGKTAGEWLRDDDNDMIWGWEPKRRQKRHRKR